MDIERLENIIESLLFIAGAPVSVKDLQEKLELQASEVTKAVNKLKEKYGGVSGIHIIRFNDKLQFQTNPEYAEPVSLVLNPVKEREMSRACMETVAIIAYKQPITKLEIEQIRGVNSDYAMQILVKHNLVTAVGRKDAVGKPFLFGTTEEFLKRFRLESIDELPDYEKLLEHIAVLQSGKQADESLYNFEMPDISEEELPAHLQGEENIEKV